MKQNGFEIEREHERALALLARMQRTIKTYGPFAREFLLSLEERIARTDMGCTNRKEKDRKNVVDE